MPHKVCSNFAGTLHVTCTSTGERQVVSRLQTGFWWWGHTVRPNSCVQAFFKYPNAKLGRHSTIFIPGLQSVENLRGFFDQMINEIVFFLHLLSNWCLVALVTSGSFHVKTAKASCNFFFFFLQTSTSYRGIYMIVKARILGYCLSKFRFHTLLNGVRGQFYQILYVIFGNFRGVEMWPRKCFYIKRNKCILGTNQKTNLKKRCPFWCTVMCMHNSFLTMEFLVYWQKCELYIWWNPPLLW